MPDPNDKTEEPKVEEKPEGTEVPEVKPEEKPKVEEKPKEEAPPDLSEQEKKLQESAKEVETLKQESVKLSERLEKLEATIKARNESDLSALSDSDKAMVASLSGDDPLKTHEVIAVLKKAGKIGTKGSSTDQTRTAGKNLGNEKPKTWDDANKGFATALQKRPTK